MSFDDARRRAEGQLAARGVRNPSASQVNSLARAIQAAEPERLAELATKRAKDDIEIGESQLVSADKDSFNTSISNSTSLEGVVDYNQALNEYVRGGGSSKGYLEFLRKGQELEQKATDAGREPNLESVIVGDPETGFRVLVQDGRIMQATPIRSKEDVPSAIIEQQAKMKMLEDATEDYFSGDPKRIQKAERAITVLNIKSAFAGQLSAKEYFGIGRLTNVKDAQAYQFAIDNPDDPRSKEVLARIREKLDGQQ